VTRPHQALDDRKRVERAKGILMSQLSLGETEAFRRIQKLARNTNRRLVDVADFVVENEALIAPLLTPEAG
jgi:AmiR/NasT family two-component response regulator